MATDNQLSQSLPSRRSLLAGKFSSQPAAPYDDPPPDGSTGAPPRKGYQQTTDEYTHGVVQANGVNFSYIERGKGPLALCLHGFPDSPFGFRFLMSTLAAAGYRVVCPWGRGYFPTEAPSDPDSYRVETLVDDAVALRDALGGNNEAILIGHGLGAMAAWGVGSHAPNSFRRIIIQGMPPMPVLAPMLQDYQHIKRAFFFWWLQMPYSAFAYNAYDYAIIDRLWADFSPGYDGAAEAAEHRKCYEGGLRERDILALFRNIFNQRQFSTPAMVKQQTEVWGRPIKIPVLYMHGTYDGFMQLDGPSRKAIRRLLTHRDSKVEMLDGVGHFMNVEEPKRVSRLIRDFIAERP
jgi:pimeloyl-ACP methyl ester carboxylesterase